MQIDLDGIKMLVRFDELLVEHGAKRCNGAPYSDFIRLTSTSFRFLGADGSRRCEDAAAVQ